MLSMKGVHAGMKGHAEALCGGYHEEYDKGMRNLSSKSSERMPTRKKQQGRGRATIGQGGCGVQRPARVTTRHE